MKEQKDVIGLGGQGLIYKRVKHLVEGRYRIVPCDATSSPQQLAACRIVVYCSDTWFPTTLQQINRHCLQAGVALLPVYTHFDEGVIGPCVVPQRPGCTSCAELRTFEATSSDADRKLLHHYREQEHATGVAQPWLSSFSLETLAVLVSEEIAAYLQRPAQLRTACALLMLSLASLACHIHTFLPSSACPDCGALVEDRAELAAITLQSRPKADAWTYRMSQPLATPEKILAAYADPRAGLVPFLAVEHTNLLPIASARLSPEAEATTGTGCTLCCEQSKVVSVLEVVERYAGLRPRGKRTAVRASYRQLSEDGQAVLDPTTLGLHSPEQYEHQEHNHARRQLVPYHPDLVCHWVWGYSFQRRTPLLVPEHCAYYGLPASAENPVFVSDVSNGCALGNCLEEAIFHGMLEVVERDAFLLTWYAQLQLPRLDMRSLTDPTIRVLLEHLEYHAGYTIQAFNATLDHAIPCLCLLGIDEQNREGKQKALVAAGSHPHPEQALLKALREFAMYQAFPRQMDQQSRSQALAMLADAGQVQKMEHHPLLYGLPEAFERLHFLYHTPRQQTFQEAFRDFYTAPAERMDLRDDLESLLHTYLKDGTTDVIVVDQTAPEHHACGLRCVKVLMPGMLPMTFGHNNRRVAGFERLHQLPFMLGYQDHALMPAEINPHPHPFF